MSRFSREFSEPVPFSEGALALSAETFTREEAAGLFAHYLERPVAPADLVADRVRWQFAPEGMTEDDGPNPGWWLGASGRGSKPVWVWEWRPMR